MKGDRKSRFLKLERSRKEAPTAPSAPAHSSRFEAVEQPSAEAPRASSSGASAARFQEPPPALDDARPSTEMPFLRCARCEADNGARAAHCQQCGAGLDSPEQRAFNEALWQKRLAEKESEDAALEVLREARAQAEAEASQLRREGAAAFAREVSEANRRRLEAKNAEDAAKAGFGREGEVLDLVARWLRRAPPLVLGSLLAGTVAAVAILLAVQGLRILGIAAVSIGALALLKLALR